MCFIYNANNHGIRQRGATGKRTTLRIWFVQIVEYLGQNDFENESHVMKYLGLYDIILPGCSTAAESEEHFR